MTDINLIKELIDDELYKANLQHPMFASNHEAYAVMLEEFEEAKEELGAVGDMLTEFWQAVRMDDFNIKELAEGILQASICLIQEAIQVGAMAKKTVISQDLRK